jgi:hypothetical protein
LPGVATLLYSVSCSECDDAQDLVEVAARRRGVRDDEPDLLGRVDTNSERTVCVALAFGWIMS